MALSRVLKTAALVVLIFTPYFVYFDNIQAQDRFRELSEKNTRHKLNSPYGSHHKLTTSNRFMETSPSDSPFQRETQYLCEGEDCGDSDALDKKLSRIGVKSGDKPLNVFAPLAGLTDTLYSQVHADQLSSSMESPMVMYHATMLLTEPAVGSAVNAAMLESLGSVQNRYLAELHFSKQLDQQPEMKEIVLRAYNSCIANNIRERRGSWDEDSPDDQASWIQAQSNCMADRIASISKLNGEDFNEFAGAEPGATGWGFNFMHDSANRIMLSNSGLQPSNYDTIYLTDYLFNEVTSDESELSPDEIDDLKDNFRKFIGDYIFRFDVNQPTSGASGGKRSASRAMQYERIKPAKNFQEWHKEKEEEIYTTMMGMLFKKCDHKNKILLTNKPFDESNLLCTPSGELSNIEDFVKVSVGSYQFDCAMLDMVYAQFRKSNPEIDSMGGSCDTFTVAFEAIKGHDSLKNRGHQLVAFLASKIATTQIYSNMVLFQQILESITPTDRGDSFLKTFSNQLLVSAAGPHDYLNEYKAESTALNEKVRVEIQEQMAIDSGKAVRKFGNIIHTSKNSPGTLSASPHQGN